MADREMDTEYCRCGHARRAHADRDSALEVVPLSMTEADRDATVGSPSIAVRGGGACTVEGCGCRQFTDAP